MSENPLPGLGCVVLSEATPPPFGPSGICCVHGVSASSPVTYLEYSTVRQFSFKDCSVLADSKPIFYTGTAEQAKRLSELLCQLKDYTIDQRELAIKGSLHRMLDTRTASKRWRAYRRLSNYLSFGSWMLFAILILFAVQVLIFKFHVSATWPLAIPALVLIIHLTSVFKRVHKVLFPNNLADRWKQVAQMLLTPTACMRVNDVLIRELFAGYHSLVVAKLILPEAESRQFANRVWRELIHCPDFEKCEDNCDTAKWVEHNWRTVVSKWIEEEFGGLEGWSDPPSKTSSDCIGYCPRCLAQYVSSRSHCADCPGVPLKSF